MELTYSRGKQAKHAEGQHSWGVDGDTGKVVDMKTYGLYESAAVKVQILKTAVEVSQRGDLQYLRGVKGRLLMYWLFPHSSQAACMLLRIDDIVSSKKQQSDQPPPQQMDDGPE